MPGLVGFTDVLRAHNTEMLSRMRSLLKYFDSYIDDELFSDSITYCSGTHLSSSKLGRQPFVQLNGIFTWSEGELYNRDELKERYELDASLNNINEILASIYNVKRSFKYLKDVDGCFAAILYDKNQSRIYLITDRYGFKPLYWGIINGNLVWSSELKGFLAHREFNPRINRTAVEEFFYWEYIRENNTWFDSIEMMPPASILTYDLKERTITVERYWSWSDVKALKEPINEDEVADELGRLFLDSVQGCVNDKEKICIGLSGGLDSRAIVAAFPKDRPFHTFTFGQHGCDDIRIAKQVAGIRGSTHHELEISVNNWLIPRIELLWKADASVNMLHFHGVEFVDEYKKYADTALSGFLGDAIIGGSYLVDYETVECRVRNRGRRFINYGLTTAEVWMVVRRPFFNNKLFDLIISIPERLRKNSYIYNKMLLRTFPEYYKDIPWQNTGYPISYGNWRAKLSRCESRVRNKLERQFRRLGFNLKTQPRNYTNYNEWLREQPAKSFFENVLSSKDAIYPEYVDRQKIQSCLRDHMEGRGNFDIKLCTALTFEIWLQMIIRGKYRNLSDIAEISSREGLSN